MTTKGVANIPESYFEYRAKFSVPMFEMWTLPNPLVSSLFSAFTKWKVGLGDIKWNREAGTYKDLEISVNVPEMNALIKFGIDAATFSALNPDWSSAPGLTDVFEVAMQAIRRTAHVEVSSQEMVLAMHVSPGEKSFGEAMTSLVNTAALGTAEMYGISAYRKDSSLVIDKSARYPDSVFIRLERRLDPSVSFGEMAKMLYEDESRALGLLGLQEIPEG